MSTYDFRLEGRLDFPRLDFEPIDPPEERVGADVFIAFGIASQPLDGLLGQELNLLRDFLKKMLANCKKKLNKY